MSASPDEMPLLCGVCLGDNPFVRMERLPFGKKRCNMSALPYQAFRWRPQHGRYKETVVSREVAAERNVCQCCLNDLQFGLPVAVRDAVLRPEAGEAVKSPQSERGRLYRYSRPPDVYGVAEASEQRDVAGAALLERLARKEVPGRVALRNLPKLCTFWLGGQCRRAGQGRCPFRPCCGAFLFPEIARDSDMHARLVAALEQQGPAAVQTSLDKDTRAALKDSLRGNPGEAIRKRLRGEDGITQRTLGRVEEMVTRSLNTHCLWLV